MASRFSGQVGRELPAGTMAGDDKAKAEFDAQRGADISRSTDDTYIDYTL